MLYTVFFFICFGTIFTSKVYIFKTLSANITTDHQKGTFFKQFIMFSTVLVQFTFIKLLLSNF